MPVLFPSFLSSHLCYFYFHTGDFVQNKSSYKLSADFKKKAVKKAKDAAKPKKEKAAPKKKATATKKKTTTKKTTTTKAKKTTTAKKPAAAKKATTAKKPAAKKATTAKKPAAAKKATPAKKPAAAKKAATKKVSLFLLLCVYAFTCLLLSFGHSNFSRSTLTHFDCCTSLRLPRRPRPPPLLLRPRSKHSNNWGSSADEPVPTYSIVSLAALWCSTAAVLDVISNQPNRILSNPPLSQSPNFL